MIVKHPRMIIYCHEYLINYRYIGDVSLGDFEFLYVAIEKFTKWPEVEPVRTMTAQSAIKFLKGLVCHFRVPARVITDNGTQLTRRAFLQYVHALGNKVSFSSVAHPRSNEQAERANTEVL